MLLPWEYGVRNLSRRPLRTMLTLSALTTVVVLVFVVVGFIRGLERSLETSGDKNVVLVYSVTSGQNLENSAISAATPSLLAASLRGVHKRYGVAHVSPELYMGTRVTMADGKGRLGLVRGVTRTVPLVRRNVRLIEGSWPQSGQVLVGRLAAAKLGTDVSGMSEGQTLRFEGRLWTISGQFSAGGGACESEIWCNLEDCQVATKRQDLSLVAVLMKPDASAAEVALFCKERNDLELRGMAETDYYATLQQHYKPLRLLAWSVVLLVSAAGVFTGLNLMYGAVAGRTRELATLQALGFRRRAVLLSLVQESVLLSAAASLFAGVLALTLIDGLAVRFTMGAFALQIDSVTVLVSCGVGLFLGVAGSLPPALKALRESVAINLKAV